MKLVQSSGIHMVSYLLSYLFQAEDLAFFSYLTDILLGNLLKTVVHETLCYRGTVTISDSF